MASQATQSRDSQRRVPARHRSASHQEASSSTTEHPLFADHSDTSDSSSVMNDTQLPPSSSARSQNPSKTSPTQTQQTQTEEVQRCWICQQDATDDTPETSEWRRPCPCSLTAHNECLLEWITSNEAPKPGAMATPRKVECPVCRSTIQVQRPRDLIVLTTDLIHSVARYLVVPTALSALIGCFYSGFFMYGLNSMELVFGQIEARKMLMPTATDLKVRQLAENSGFWKALFRIFKISDPFMPLMPGLKLCIGLPLIAPGLVLARTRLADHLFAVLPISYFVFNPTRRLDLTTWPPSPALTLAVLPYIRTTYNELYRHTFSDLEKKWDKAVQRKPREGETDEQILAENQRNEHGDGFFDLEVQMVEENGAQEDEIQQVEAAPEVVEPEVLAIVEERLEEAIEWRDQFQRELDVGGLDDALVGELQNAVGEAARDVEELRERLQENVQPPPNPRRGNRDGNAWQLHRNVSTAHVASTVMGALFFPAISSIMGDLLKATLPTQWVGKGSNKWGLKAPGGLLKERWGRSIIGGCLFVVLKDAVTLYCKWKKARDFGKKQILDYVGERKRD